MNLETVVTDLRSCLISSKGGIKLDNLNMDYRMVVGESLPYKKFGFPTIEAFVSNVPDIIVTKRGGELYVEAAPSSSTAHLTKLIARQKVSRPKVRRKPAFKKSTLPRSAAARGNSSGLKCNGPQFSKNNYQNPPSPFTRSTPGRSNLYTDFNRPVPLMETIVQRPLSLNNERSTFASNTSQDSPSKRLKDKVTKSNISNQSTDKFRTDELKSKISFEKTVPPMIGLKPKTVEPKLPKQNEKLNTRSAPPLVNACNNGYVCPSTASDVSQIAPIESYDPRKELEMRANMLNIPPPTYKTYKTQTGKGNSAKKVTYAIVKIGHVYTFHTYPEDANSEEEAEKIAARLALVSLAKEISNLEVTTVDVNLVKERILAIVTKHHSGVFMHQLPTYYGEQHDEALPDGWQKIVEKCPDINKEKGVGNSTILCRTDSTSKPLEVPSPSKEIHSDISSSFSEKIQLNPIGPAAPDKLKIPDTIFWNVYTTYITSTVEVWVRLVDEDYNDNFIDMMNEMTEYYNQVKESVSTTACVIGDFYTILDDNIWHRVQCVDFESDTGIATVHFIDEGYEDSYEQNLLHPLEKRFCILPAQAVKMALKDLEDFRDCSQIITELDNHLLDQVFCVKVHNTNKETPITATFYDTSGEDDVDMNKVLFKKILDNITAASQMHVGKLVKLYVTHIEKSGKVYAQLDTPARTCLLNLLNDETMSRIPLNVMINSLVRAINFTKMYFVQLNSQWYRAKVTDICDESEITVFLVDIGQTVAASRGNLLQMDKISKVLQSIPPQAMQIFLHNIDQSMYGERFVSRFGELVSETDLLLAKVVKITVSGVPIVEIFKRIGPNNMLASINTSLIYEELIRSNEDGNNNVKPKKRLERKNSCVIESFAKLKPPTISDIGHYFDVHVALAAHPEHFIVQPLNDRNNLKTMMLKLQKCYSTYEGPQLEVIGEGKLYAGKSIDNCWYRIYVTNFISDNMVSVYFCDFGDVTILPRSSLQPLKSEFLELPYQAVKAKLVGIKPINTDWSVDDCVRFRDLVLYKNFVSVVVESTFDHLSPANDSMLGLRLIDVSTEKDIYIDELLVQENRAKFIEKENLPSS